MTSSDSEEITWEWNESINEFENRLKQYRCSGEKHEISEQTDTTWCEVQAHYYDYNRDERYATLCVCMSKDIAINEACRRLYYEYKGAFNETINPFSKYAKRLANNKAERIAQLEKMQEQLMEIVQCKNCFHIGYNDHFYCQCSNLKLLVQPYYQLITKMRKNNKSNYKEKDDSEDSSDNEPNG